MRVVRFPQSPEISGFYFVFGFCCFLYEIYGQAIMPLLLVPLQKEEVKWFEFRICRRNLF
jgi:hypothetical protein